MFWIIIVLTGNSVVFTELSCDLLHSINITDGIKYPNGSIFHDGNEYTQEDYGFVDEITVMDHSRKSVDKHLRGCICHSKFSMNCLPLCCPPGFAKKDNFDSKCENSDNDIILDTSSTGTNKINGKALEENYRLVQGVACEKKFYLDSEDQWTLLKVIKSISILIL